MGQGLLIGRDDADQAEITVLAYLLSQGHGKIEGMAFLGL